ncbi:beta-1,3-galactosyltransferase 5-like [Mizuhopecten yessoensis]|uniref:Hexosyltransferase n=1 Tax=Mizuhopecten yessoensis TaxID=6573 RepID=A0A210PFC0_MIZYE|nr:beta-1,3-galactosyltransferase 5-like [Mizuhopecten yessoensis]OWF35190.1 Beta-1,3-galactosyltransferase 5 [Mizuhopecten yessoensis]
MKRYVRRNFSKGLMFGAAILVVWFFFLQITNNEKTLSFPDLLNFSYQDENIQPKPFLVVPNLKHDRQSARNIVVVVLSKASNILQRQTIRQTWGNQDMQIKYNFSVYFVVGKEERDINERGDIVQVDVVEDYYNLTDKTCAAFNWVTQFCREARYFFKVDDDVFLDLDFLIQIQTDSTYLPDDTILGSCQLTASPERKWTKWQVSYGEYPFKTYPPFCNGPGYMMTLSTAHKVYVEMTKTRTFKLEDVYVGIVAYKLGLSIKHVENFVFNMNIYVFPWFLNDLFCRCHTIIHYATPENVQQLWDGRAIIGRDKSDCSFWGIGKFLLT